MRQYLTFRLGGLEYALDYRNVQELRPLQALERFAADGEIISGVAVSRGIIMPVVDMRIAFGPRPSVTPIRACGKPRAAHMSVNRTSSDRGTATIARPADSANSATASAVVSARVLAPSAVLA